MYTPVHVVNETRCLVSVPTCTTNKSDCQFLYGQLGRVVINKAHLLNASDTCHIPMELYTTTWQKMPKTVHPKR